MCAVTKVADASEVGHCHVKLTGIDNKRDEIDFTQSKGAKVNKYLGGYMNQMNNRKKRLK